MEQIKYADIVLHPLSSSSGAYFFYYKNKLYRSPIEQYSNLVKTLASLNFPEIQNIQLITDQLVIPNNNTLITQNIYEHKIYHHMVKVMECTRVQVKNMLKALCDLQIKLISHNLIIYDIHEHNVAYTEDGVKWLDICGIGELDWFINQDHIAIYSYVKFCYLILKYILCNFEHGDTVFNGQVIMAKGGTLANFMKLDWKKITSWQLLKDYIDSINIVETSTHWSDHYPYDLNSIFQKDINTKVSGLHDLLEVIPEITSATDVGCNKGLYTFILSKNLKSVIAFDVDEKCINLAESLNKDKFHLPILFAKTDLDKIENLHDFDKNRYRSDLVMALAMVHHLKIQGLSIAAVVKFLLSLSTKYVLIEDIDSVAEYEQEFIANNYYLVKRVLSEPQTRTLSLYSRRINAQ